MMMQFFYLEPGSEHLIIKTADLRVVERLFSGADAGAGLAVLDTTAHPVQWRAAHLGRIEEAPSDVPYLVSWQFMQFAGSAVAKAFSPL
jgi:hypothetical protein